MAERERFGIRSLYVKNIDKLLPGDDVLFKTRIDFTGITTDTTNHVAGLLMKAGTSSVPIVADIADGRFFDLNFDNGATSGDNRGIYVRLALTGAGGGGEAARLYTDCTVATGTAHGAHISLGMGTDSGAGAGSITGLGVACRATLHVLNDVTISGGTLYAGLSEIYFEGDNSSTTDISGATRHAIHCFNLLGDTTARAKAQFAFDFTNIPSGTGTEMVKTDMHTGTPTDGLKIRIDGTTYYISLVSA